MRHFPARTIGGVLWVSFFLSASGQAQSNTDSSRTSYPSTPLPANSSGAPYPSSPLPPGKRLAPFALGVPSPGNANFLEYRAENQMTEEDRAVLLRAQPSIQELASIAGMEFEQGKWSYQQLVCQALPAHLFLIFQRENGANDVSRFSIAVPRGGSGRIRILPILRRSYTPYSPAPVNALTVAAFNRIRAGEPASGNADWLSTSLCYAALTGARPEVTPLQKNSGAANSSLTYPPTIAVDTNGESTVHFVDVAVPRRPMDWALTFDSTGRLLKVTHFAAPVYAATIIP